MNKETPMIKNLRLRFIALAMISLILLLSVIVAGMNIINYNKVVSDADVRLDVLEQNRDRIKDLDTGFGGFENNGSRSDDVFFGRRGPGGPKMSMDEAEESRFFTVVIAEDGTVLQTNIDRIFAVDESEAGDYAERALASGKDSGFVGDFRYSVSSADSSSIEYALIGAAGVKEITFLDCGRVLASYRDFLKYSVLMSLAGLLIIFAAIAYFSGRIVRPVAESYEKQKRFITDAGHEIKTPLAIIKANLDVIDMDPDSSEESLHDIGEQVDRLTRLTNDLVYLSRMEESGGGLVMADFPISDVVSDVTASFEALARDNAKTIEQDIEPMLTANGSTKEIEKLVSILIENAIKYSDGSEPIKVCLRRDGRNAVLEVANRTTEPVDKDSLSHVFDRFYRSDESRNSMTGGHGIGLSMANAIVQTHKGKISAETGTGHDFIITAALPLQN